MKLLGSIFILLGFKVCNILRWQASWYCQSVVYDVFLTAFWCLSLILDSMCFAYMSYYISCRRFCTLLNFLNSVFVLGFGKIFSWQWWMWSRFGILVRFSCTITAWQKRYWTWFLSVFFRRFRLGCSLDICCIELCNFFFFSYVLFVRQFLLSSKSCLQLCGVVV